MPIPSNDVIHYEVLTRLPVKSLLRFKTVCKYWYNLINSSTFLNIYRKYAIESHDDYSRDDLLICNFRSFIFDRLFCDQCFISLYAPQFSRGISFDFDKQFDMAGFVGVSCNGVLCVSTTEFAFALCNPITKECRIIEEPRHYYNYSLGIINGFGYDYVSDDYKIIQICEYLSGNQIQLGGIALIYSTRTNSWKKGTKFSSSITNIKYRGPSEVNNALHYICSVTTFTDDTCLSIFTVDLHTEKFKCMTLPVKLTKEDLERSCRLMASNGHLYFSLINFKSYATIWVMKEYGVIDSWTKLYELQGDIVRSKIISYNLSSEGGEVLVIEPVDEQSDELVWYNLEDKSFRKVDVPGKRKYSRSLCVCMKGSLAPIIG